MQFVLLVGESCTNLVTLVSGFFLSIVDIVPKVSGVSFTDLVLMVSGVSFTDLVLVVWGVFFTDVVTVVSDVLSP